MTDSIPAEVLTLLREVYTDEGCLIWWTTRNGNLRHWSPQQLWAHPVMPHADVLAEARRLTGDLNG